MSGHEFVYVGQELELFAEAQGWKTYMEQQVRPFLGRRVLEVGAGLGASSKALCHGRHDSWVCVEPDARQASLLQRRIVEGDLPACCNVVVGGIHDTQRRAFDTVLYIDVLEHIEQDQAELVCAAERLTPGGHLVVLSPAHPQLYSEFDRAIGHYRRYTKASLTALGPPGCVLVRLRYLDAAGGIASLANRLLLCQALPRLGQVYFWDRVLLPLSRRLDVMTGYRIGRTLLAAWQLQSHDSPHSLPPTPCQP